VSIHKNSNKKQEAKELYDMNLHDVAHPECGWIIIRVPGGWIYRGQDVAVFVPYNNSFYELVDDDLPF